MNKKRKYRSRYLITQVDNVLKARPDHFNVVYFKLPYIIVPYILETTLWHLSLSYWEGAIIITNQKAPFGLINFGWLKNSGSH